MKNLKRISKIICVAFCLLFAFKNASAQVTITVNVTSGSATVGLCPNTTYIVNFTLPSGYTVYPGSPLGQYYTWSGGTPSCINYADNQVSLCLLSGQSNSAYVRAGGNGSEFDFNIYFVMLKTSVIGVSEVCYGSTPSFTAISNTGGSVTGWTWTTPSFDPITSGQSTATINTSATHHGTGTVSVTTTTSDGCGTYTGLSGSLSLKSDSGTPGAPAGALSYTEAGGSCEYDANISTTGTAFEWSLDNFSTILASTSTPHTTGGDFEYSTNYTVYLKVQNACSTTWSPSNNWNKTTPGKPRGCISAPIRLTSQVVMPTNFKLYPNPATKTLNLEYPTPADNSMNVICTVYDMLGHKIAYWNLPNSENIVTEDISTLQEGVYLYIISSGSDILSRGKLMILK